MLFLTSQPYIISKRKSQNPKILDDHGLWLFFDFAEKMMDFLLCKLQISGKHKKNAKGDYDYASTEAILNRALKRLHLLIGKPERVELNCGDILKLRPSGQMERASFDAANLLCPWSSFSLYPVQRKAVPQQHRAEQEYLDTLKGVAAYYGYEPSSIDELLDVGFSTDEIEELLYERMIY